jgi:predicted  nucleic acid-binding Zn-ribbon protein
MNNKISYLSALAGMIDKKTVSAISKEVSTIKKNAKTGEEKQLIAIIEMKIAAVKTETDTLAAIQLQLKDLARKSDLTDFATKSDVKNIDLSHLVTIKDLKNLATQHDVKGLATSSEVGKLATSKQIDSLATSKSIVMVSNQVNQLATTKQVDNLATAKQVDALAKAETLNMVSSQIESLATASDLQSVAEQFAALATKADVNGIIEKDEIKALVKVIYTLKDIVSDIKNVSDELIDEHQELATTTQEITDGAAKIATLKNFLENDIVAFDKKVIDINAVISNLADRVSNDVSAKFDKQLMSPLKAHVKSKFDEYTDTVATQMETSIKSVNSMSNTVLNDIGNSSNEIRALYAQSSSLFADVKNLEVFGLEMKAKIEKELATTSKALNDQIKAVTQSADHFKASVDTVGAAMIDGLAIYEKPKAAKVAKETKD